LTLCVFSPPVQASLGCCRRYHQPPESDAIYDKVVEKVTLRDQVETAVPPLFFFPLFSSPSSCRSLL